MGLFSFTETIGVDPGSRNLRIVKEGNILFDEPALLSVNEGLVSGFGNSVLSTKEHILVKPVTYTIGDFQAFEELLKAAINKAFQSKSLLKPSLNMYFSIPSHASIVEKRAYRDSGEFSGASKLYMIDQSVTASVGMGILLEKKDYILIDFGSDKIQMSAFADSIPVESALVRLGIQKILDLVKNFLYRDHQLNVTDHEVIEMLKKFSQHDPIDTITVKQSTINFKEIDEVLSHYFFLVNDEFMACFDRLRKHKRFDHIKANGIFYTGGGSAIDFIRKKVAIDATLTFHISKTPLMDTINGLGKLMANHAMYDKYITQ